MACVESYVLDTLGQWRERLGVDLVVDLVVGEIVDLIAGELAVRVVGLGKKMDLAKMLLERRYLRTVGGFWTVF